jgi:hypothetical protein
LNSSLTGALRNIGLGKDRIPREYKSRGFGITTWHNMLYNLYGIDCLSAKAGRYVGTAQAIKEQNK